MTVLVTGATGNVGRRVVDRLFAAGRQVRALTRRPEAAGLPAGVEAVRGDLTDPAALDGALAGVEAAFLFPVPETAREFAARAKAAGVRHVAVLSSAATGYAEATPIGERHRAVERAVEEAGLRWTHVRPGAFAANALAWAPSIRAEGVVREPHGRAGQTPIHEDDIAAVAATALLEDGHAGRVYTLSGPEVITIADQVRAIGAAIGRDVRFEEISPESAREQWIARGVPAAVADSLLQYRSRAAEAVLPTVEQVTGRPARTFAEWARDHAADFR